MMRSFTATALLVIGAAAMAPGLLLCLLGMRIMPEKNRPTAEPVDGTGEVKVHGWLGREAYLGGPRSRKDVQ